MSISFGNEQYRERILVRVELGVHHRRVEHAQQRWPGRELLEELCGCCVEGPEEKLIDSVKAIGSMEAGVTCEEPNVLEFDEYAEELQNVFDSISGVRLDPELSRASRKVEIDFMSRLEVYCRRPRTWAKDKGIHVIPTKWVDVNKCDDKRPEYGSGFCGKELKRWDPPMPGTFASMGLFECVVFLLSRALMWGGPSARKILFVDASRAHCQAATSEMAIELPPGEQVSGART